MASWSFDGKGVHTLQASVIIRIDESGERAGTYFLVSVQYDDIGYTEYVVGSLDTAKLKAGQMLTNMIRTSKDS